MLQERLYIREKVVYAPPPSRPWITSSVTRVKRPEADLRRHYPAALGVSLVISAALLGVLALAFPAIEVRALAVRPEPVFITIEDIPETYQAPKPPQAELPVVAMDVEGTAVPDSALEEEDDLDFLANLDLASTLGSLGGLDEDPVEFWAVSKEPVLIKEVLPVYPEMAREAGIEGAVIVKFAVGSDGYVKQATVLKGPKVFHRAAVEAVSQFVFKPALQNSKPVAVWMALPIRFRLVDNPLEAQTSGVQAYPIRP